MSIDYGIIVVGGGMEMTDNQKIKKAIKLLEEVLLDGEADGWTLDVLEQAVEMLEETQEEE